ncbi:MAG: formylglycine-generating enzyme family protein [bacterium]|nr:formylglycine-generating enzyme family protein [Candidatus Colisoma equi]
MNMKSMIVVALAFSARLVFAGSPVVSDVVARQRYPWNGMVDIDYTITGDAAGLKLEIGVEDRQNGKTYTPTKFLSVLPTSAGRHRVTWSTEAEGVTIISTNVAVTVSLVRVASTEPKKDLYYVVDLSGGPTATSYPVRTLEAPPSAGWSDEYKTTKLVLRRIEAGEDPLKRYTITKPFYIGVFEVTQKQYELVTGSNPIYPDYRGDLRAVGMVSYNMIRGDVAGSNWPNSSEVDTTSFLGMLRQKTGVVFDLPTVAQWEYACRAETMSSYNNGGDTEADLRILGRYSGNSNDGRGGYSGLTSVGSYAPNAWGLYDMHGNVYEWCLDWDENLIGSDPKGAESGSARVMRSGSYIEATADHCTSSYRIGSSPSVNFVHYGFRLACAAGL